MSFCRIISISELKLVSKSFKLPQQLATKSHSINDLFQGAQEKAVVSKLHSTVVFTPLTEGGFNEQFSVIQCKISLNMLREIFATCWIIIL